MPANNKVQNVNINYLGAQNLKHIEGLKLIDQKSVPLPTRFSINGNWRISHSCLICNQNVITGADEPIVGTSSIINFLPYMEEKYFSLKTISIFSELFSNTVIKEVDDKHVLLNIEAHPDFALGIKIFFYDCAICKARYYANYDRGYGSWGEKDERPSPDVMYLAEIVTSKIPEELLIRKDRS